MYSNISQIQQPPEVVPGGGKGIGMKPINMEEFANGAFSSQINRELKKVTENIQDPNTDATVKRRITITIDFKPNENRDFVTTSVQAKSSLAPALGAVTAMNMGKNLKTGEVEAVEIGKQLPGQLQMAEVEEDMIRTVDTSTGEIYDTPVTNRAANSVIHLRAAR